MVDVPAVEAVDFRLEEVEFVVELLLFLVAHVLAHLLHDLVIAVDERLDGCHGLLEVAADILFGVQLRLLGDE